MKQRIAGFLQLNDWKILYCLTAVMLLSRKRLPITGVPRQAIRGEVDLSALAGWTGVMLMPILVNGFFLSKCKRIETLSRIRLHRRKQWLMLKFVGCALNVTLLTLILILSAALFVHEHVVWREWILLWINQILWMMVQLCLYEEIRMCIESGTACAVMISGGYLLGERFSVPEILLPTSWGMYVRIRGAGDFWIFVCMNLLGIGLCGFVLFRIIDRRGSR